MNQLQGKKTYIAAVLLAVLGIGIAVFIDPANGAAVLLVAAAIGGIGDRLNRHQRELMDGLVAIRQLLVLKQPLTPEQKAALVTDAFSVGTEAMTSPTAGVATDSTFHTPLSGGASEK